MKRRGGILMESIIAMMLLALLLTAAGQAIVMMRRQERFLSQRATALQECHIALASIASRDTVKLKTENRPAIGLTDLALSVLPDGKLHIDLTPPKTGEQGTRVRASVSWRPAPNAEPASVELSCWRFDLATDDKSAGGSP